MFPNYTESLMSFTVKAILSDYKKQDGSARIKIRATINRKHYYLPIDICVQPSDFDSKRGLVKSKSANSDLINLAINEKIVKATRVYHEHRLLGNALTPELFKAALMDGYDQSSFLKFYETEFNLTKHLLEPSTRGIHLNCLDKLKKFKGTISYSDLTIEFCQRFEKHLRDQYKLSDNTVHKVFKTIKVYVNAALKKGHQFNNPFTTFKVAKVDPTKVALSFKEVKQLYDYYLSDHVTDAQKRVLRYFIFSCITGVRISDITKIKWDHIHNDVLTFIPYKTRKQRKSVSIPLTPVAKSLLDEKAMPYLFDTISEKSTNEHLKVIANVMNIRKVITYHISRHTFATEFLDRGGNLETLQQLLGHRMITTTMQYAKVRDSRKLKELADFDSSLND